MACQVLREKTLIKGGMSSLAQNIDEVRFA